MPLGSTCSISHPSHTVSSLEEGPGNEAGPLQAPGAVHVQPGHPSWGLVGSLTRHGLSLLAALVWLPPFPCSIGMNEKQHEELQREDQT